MLRERRGKILVLYNFNKEIQRFVGGKVQSVSDFTLSINLQTVPSFDLSADWRVALLFTKSCWTYLFLKLRNYHYDLTDK